jgi:hypothetical protein
MATPTADPSLSVDWRRLHALGWPAGSVRALLAILVFAATWGLLVVRPSHEVPVYLRDLLFIIMGHYFAARRRAGQLEEAGPPPLFLPRGTIRLLLVIGSLAVAIVLYRQGRFSDLERNPGVVTLLLVGGFLLGVALSTLSTWWDERGHHTPRFVEDARALVSIGSAVILIALVWNRHLQVFPPESVEAHMPVWVHLGRYGPEHILAAVVGFYFGSRS